MRLLFLFIAIFSFLTIGANAQVKQAQKQYLRDKGAFINPGFDQGYKGWTITGCTPSLESDIPTYGKTLKLTCTNETFSIKQETTSYAGFGLEGLASCKIKASGAGVKFRRVTNGTPEAQLANVSTSYEAYEEFITFDATSDGLEVYADANYTGDVFVEDCYVGVKPDGSYELPDQSGNSGKVLTSVAGSEQWNDTEQNNGQVKNNFLENPSFENAYGIDGTVTTSGFDVSGTTSRTVEASAFNDSKFNLNTSGNATLDYTYTKTADFEGKQLISYCEIKTSNTNVTFNTMVNGGVDQTVNVDSTDNWKYYEIPFIGGDTSQGFKIDHTEAGETPDIDVDNCFIGKVSPGFVRQINVGMTDWKDYPMNISASTNPTLGAGSTVESKYRIVGDTLEVSFTINQTVLGTNGSGIYTFELPDGFTVDESKLTTLPSFGRGAVGVAHAYDNSIGELSGVARYTDDFGGGVVLQLFDQNNSNSVQSGFAGFGSDNVMRYSAMYKVPVIGYSADTNTVVTQDTELTAKTANELSFDGDGAGNVLNENYDVVNGNCTASTGDYTCMFNTDIFAVAPSCVASPADTGAYSLRVRDVTATSVRIQTFNNAGSLTNSPFNVHCSKQGADVNKSQTIIGKFENINTSNLAIFDSRSGANTTLTGDVTNIPFISVKDVNGNWNGTEFTAQDDAFYDVEGRVATSGAHCVYAWIDSGSGYTIDKLVGCSQQGGGNSMISGKVYLNSGNKMAFRVSSTVSMSATTFVHHLAISAVSDTQAIVKNLSKQKTLCQTKFLSSDTSASAFLPDLQFDNLTVGKMYSFTLNTVSSPSGVQKIYNTSGASANLIGRHAHGGSGTTDSNSTRIFTAVDTSVKVTNDLTITLYGDGTRERTHAQLCELGDLYQETNKFD